MASNDSLHVETRSGFRDTRSRTCCDACLSRARDGFTIIAVCFAVLTVAITVALSFQLQFGSPQVSPAGAVASDSALCSGDAGAAMLQRGGTAVDAAISALVCTSVTLPHLVGVGGGGVMLVHDHLQMKTHVIDFLPDVPSNAPVSPGNLAIAVPGFLQGLHAAHSLYGKLPWADLFTTAIHTAREGFIVSESLAAAVASVDTKTVPIVNVPNPDGGVTNTFMGTFFPVGKPLKQGTKLTRKPYAELLEKVALFGPQAVFVTDYSVEVVKLLHHSGAAISVADLQDYQVEVYESLQATLVNHTVYTTAPSLFAALRLVHNTRDDQLQDGGTPEGDLLSQQLVEALKVLRPVTTRMVEEPSHRYYLSQKLLDLTKQLSLDDILNFELSNRNINDLKNALNNQKNNATFSPSEDNIIENQEDFDVSAIMKDKLLASLYKLSGVESFGLADIGVVRPSSATDSLSSAATQVSAVDSDDLYVSVSCGLGSVFGSKLMTPHGVLFNDMLTQIPNTQTHRETALEDLDKYSDPSHDSTETDAQRGLLHSTDPNRKQTGKQRVAVPYCPCIVVQEGKPCGRRGVISSSSVTNTAQVVLQHLLGGESLLNAVASPRIEAVASSSDTTYPTASVNIVTKYRDGIASHSDPRGGGVAARLGGGSGVGEVDWGAVEEEFDHQMEFHQDYQKQHHDESAARGSINVSTVRKTGSNYNVGGSTSNKGGSNSNAGGSSSNVEGSNSNVGGSNYNAGGSNSNVEGSNSNVGGSSTDGGSSNQDTNLNANASFRNANVNGVSGSSNVNDDIIEVVNAAVNGPTPGSGIVVKGDKRGGISVTDTASNTDLNTATNIPNTATNTDSETGHRHISQVRLDDHLTEEQFRQFMQQNPGFSQQNQPLIQGNQPLHQRNRPLWIQNPPLLPQNQQLWPQNQPILAQNHPLWAQNQPNPAQNHQPVRYQHQDTVDGLYQPYPGYGRGDHPMLSSDKLSRYVHEAIRNGG